MSRIVDRIERRYQTRNEEIIAGLIEAAGAVAALDPKTVVKRKAAEISTTMALLHGGHWRVQIDHEVGLVIVAKASETG